MSLISLSSADENNIVSQQPFNFKNNFPQPIIIKPHSQVALVNFYHFRNDNFCRLNKQIPLRRKTDPLIGSGEYGITQFRFQRFSTGTKIRLRNVKILGSPAYGAAFGDFHDIDEIYSA